MNDVPHSVPLHWDCSFWSLCIVLFLFYLYVFILVFSSPTTANTISIFSDAGGEAVYQHGSMCCETMNAQLLAFQVLLMVSSWDSSHGYDLLSCIKWTQRLRTMIPIMTHVISLSATMAVLWCKGFAESRLQGQVRLHCVQIRFLPVLL